MLTCFSFVVLWSTGWIGSKYAQELTGTFTLLAFRYMLVVLLLLIYVTWQNNWRRIPKRHLQVHVIVGILSHALFLGTAISSTQMGVSAGIVAFITALTPMATAILSPHVSGERTSRRQRLGLCLGFAAIMMVVFDKIALGGAGHAYALPFIAVIAISVASVMDRRLSLRNQSLRIAQPPLSLIALIHCSSALCLFIPAAWLLEGFDAQWNSELLGSIVWLALFVSLGAYGIMFFLLRSMSAIKVASLTYLSPPVTMLIAYVVFGEKLTNVDMAGMLIASVAVWMVTSSKKPVRTRTRTSGRRISPNTQFGAAPPEQVLTFQIAPTHRPLFFDRSLISTSAVDIDLGQQSCTNDSGKLADINGTARQALPDGVDDIRPDRALALG